MENDTVENTPSTMRGDIDYESFKAYDPGCAEPTTQQIESWVKGEEEDEGLDDPEDFYGNNYVPGLGWG